MLLWYITRYSHGKSFAAADGPIHIVDRRSRLSFRVQCKYVYNDIQRRMQKAMVVERLAISNIIL